MEPEVITLCQQHGEKLDHMDTKLDKIIVWMRGDENKAGAEHRLEVLEAYRKAQVKVAIWAGSVFFGACILAFAAWVVMKLTCKV